MRQRHRDTLRRAVVGIAVALVVLSVVAAGANQALAWVLFDDFEDGDLSEWSGDVGDFAVTSDNPNNGTFSLEFPASDNVQDRIHRPLDRNDNTGFSWWVNVSSFGPTTHPQVWFTNTSGTLTTDIGPAIRINDTGAVISDFSGTDTGIDITTNEYHKFEITDINYTSKTYNLTVTNSSGGVVGQATGVAFVSAQSELTHIQILGDENVFYLDTIETQFEFTNHDPAINNSSATPTGGLSTVTPTLSIDVNDTEFGTQQGDTVTVEFFVDGNSVGTDTLTSNGTATVTVTNDLNGGDHTWNVTASDEYGGSSVSQDFSISVPSNLTIRNETAPHGIVAGCTANVRFYETVDDNPLISETTDSDGDGNVSLDGLPVGTEFVASVRCDGYYNRTILIEDIFSQSNAFLLHKATNDGDFIRFEIDDRTGLFAEEGEFIIERAINESEYNSSASGFRWLRIAGDEIGATDSFSITLEHEQRYRLRIQNDQGDSRILKTYIPQGDGTEQIVVGRVEWPSTPGNATVFNASIEDESSLGNTPPVIQIQFVNPANLTAEPDKAVSNFNYSVFEAGNASNEIDSGTAGGDLGTFYAETNITDSQANQKWIIQVQYEVDGETITERRVVGGSSVDIQADQDWLGLFALIGITSIGLLYGQRTANLGIALMWIAAGVAMMFELIVINEAWYVVSGFIVAGALIRSNLR